MIAEDTKINVKVITKTLKINYFVDLLVENEAKFFWALFYNVLGVPVVAGAVIKLSSVTAVSNTSLLKVKKNENIIRNFSNNVAFS